MGEEVSLAATAAQSALPSTELHASASRALTPFTVSWCLLNQRCIPSLPSSMTAGSMPLHNLTLVPKSWARHVNVPWQSTASWASQVDIFCAI